MEEHGDAQHQEPAGWPLPQAAIAGAPRAPLRRAAGHRHARRATRIAEAAVDPGPAGTRQGRLDRHRRCGPRATRTGVVGLIDDLGDGPVAVDTAPFIYFIEGDARYAPLVESLFQLAAHGSRHLVTSTLTLMELLVVPYRAGNQPLADQYEALLTRSRGL